MSEIEKEIHKDIQTSDEMKNLHSKIHNLDEMSDLKEYISYIFYKNDIDKDYDVNVTISVKLVSPEQQVLSGEEYSRMINDEYDKEE